jgi:DNA-binding transcriptional ArsR family regulator
MNMQQNEAMEFYCFLSSYIEKHLEKEKETANIPPDPGLLAIYREVDRTISPFLKHDIDLLFHTMVVTLIVLFFHIHRREITDDLQFLESLSSMSDEQFRRQYLMYLNLEEREPQQISLKEIRERITQNLVSTSKNQDKLLKQLLDDPGEWRRRIVNTLNDFHRMHYLPRRDELAAMREKKTAEARELFREDPIRFLDTLTLGHYRDLLSHANDAVVYISYTFDTGMLISIKGKIMLLGLTRTTLVTSENRKLQTNILFNTLCDVKRIEILRLLGEREWFSNELAKHFGLTAATMSYHLNKMLGAGLVSFRIGDKNKIYYSINRNNVRSLLTSALADLAGEDAP